MGNAWYKSKVWTEWVHYNKDLTAKATRSISEIKDKVSYTEREQQRRQFLTPDGNNEPVSVVQLKNQVKALEQFLAKIVAYDQEIRDQYNRLLANQLNGLFLIIRDQLDLEFKQLTQAEPRQMDRGEEDYSEPDARAANPYHRSFIPPDQSRHQYQQPHVDPPAASQPSSTGQD